MGYQFFMMMIPFILSPYLARVFGPENIGRTSFISNINNYFILFASLGVSVYGNREIAFVRNDKKKLSQIFMDIFFVHFIVGSIIFVIYLFFCFYYKNDQILYLISSLNILATIVDISWFYAGIEKFKITIFRNVLMKVCCIILIFLFVHSHLDIGLYLFINASTLLIGQLLTWIALTQYITFVKPDHRKILYHLKQMIILFVPIVAMNIYHQMDKTLLGIMSTNAELGFYVYAERIIAIPVALFSVVSTVMMPRISHVTHQKQYEQQNQYINIMFKLNIFLSIGSFFGLLAISHIFVELFFGIDFYKVSDIVKCLSLTLPIIGFSNVIGNGYLLPNKKDNIWILSLVVGGIVNLVADMFLIRYWYALGAAWGTVLAELSVLIVQFILCKNNFDWKVVFKYVFRNIISGIVMFLIVYQILFHGETWQFLILSVSIGFIVYAFLSFLISKILNKEV